MASALVELPYIATPQRTQRKTKSRPASREQHLQNLLLAAYETYVQSQFAQNIDRQVSNLVKSASAPITHVLSLGLGSLSSTEKGQTRRLKQLVILLAIRTSLQRLSKGTIEVYAQDPTFTRQDEALLSSLNVRILRTSSGSSLGEAASKLTSSTLVYSPFLTLEAYEQLFIHSKQPVPYLIGDDFNSLMQKWPKHSAERSQVEQVTKSALGQYRRKAISGSGFWDDSDGAFPMAVYAVNNMKEKKL